VSTEVVRDYLTIISKPMDYGTIIRKLENGEYYPSESKDEGKKQEMDAMEEILLLVLLDVYQVHHNCFLYNPKGSNFYRAGEVQRGKWNAYFNKHLRDQLPRPLQARLADFHKSCEAKRGGQPARRFQATDPTRYRGEPVAVFDPDTKRIVKQYSSKSSAKTAALMLHGMGYKSELELTPSNVKLYIDRAEDPSRPLFGYQWVPTEKLRAGNFLVKPYFRNDDLASPTPNNIVILKEDTVSGVKLRGFESEESAHQDWLEERAASFSARVENDGLEDGLPAFVKGYLDGDKSINGIVWGRVEPETAATLPKSPMKVVMEEEHASMK
jgi:hypothetical protein